MKALAVTVFFVFALTFVAAPTMGGGWFWDAGNGLGFVAFAGLVFLTITSNRRLDVRAHRVLGYYVLALAAMHAFWFLLGDATVAEFVKPGAPDYMWLGIVSLVLLTILMTGATVPDRLRWHTNYRSFRYWHRVLTVAVILSAAYHIVVSGFYLRTWFQALAFAMLAIGICVGRPYWNRLGQIDIPKPIAYLAISIVSVAVFAGMRNLPA